MLEMLKRALELLKVHSYLAPFAIALVGAVTAISAFKSYFSTVRWNFTRYLADRYFEIFRLALTNPDLMNPSKTRRYDEKWPAGHSERPAYEAYARLCWSHASDIYGAKFPILFRKEFIKKYANAFETYRRLHGRWLDKNRTFFPSRRFLRFIDKCKWRDYFDPRTADILRWNNEVEDFEEKVLYPLRAVPTNPLLNYINSLPGKSDMVVADVGCGNGGFVLELAKHPFRKIYGGDSSDNMLETARRNCRELSDKVIIKKLDALDLSEHYGEFDIVFSLNSILPRNPSDTPVMLREIARALKPRGLFVAVLPSFDTLLDLKKIERPLFIERRAQRLPRFAKRHSIIGTPLAWIRGRNDLWKAFHWDKRMSGWIDSTLGRFRLCRLVASKFGCTLGPDLFADDGANLQRFINGDDIEQLLKKADLDLREKMRFEYSWEVATKYGYGHFKPEIYERLKANLIYDWFVVANKVDQPS